MLRQETNETVPISAAQVRVTPEELAAALSQIEGRKEAGQRHADGTIPIGEAVQQLGIDTTPEEVLAEVQALRREPIRTNKGRPSVAGHLVLALGLGGILLGVALDGNGLAHLRSQPSAKPVSVSSIVPQPSNVPKPISLDPNLMVQDASGKIVMLSEVGDNQPVQCTFDNKGDAFSQYSFGNTRALWTIIKHDGRVYVRGRILKLSPKVFSSDGADVTNVDDDPDFVVPVTLPLNGFDAFPGVGNNIEFHAVNIHLDKHAYEKWRP